MKSFNGENSCCAIAAGQCEWADHAPLTSRVGSPFSGGWNWMWRTQRSALCNICGSGERWKTVISQPWASTLGRTDHTFQSICRLFYSVIRCFIAFINGKNTNLLRTHCVCAWRHVRDATGKPGEIRVWDPAAIHLVQRTKQSCWYSDLEEHAQSLWVTCYDHRLRSHKHFLGFCTKPDVPKHCGQIWTKTQAATCVFEQDLAVEFDMLWPGRAHLR